MNLYIGTKIIKAEPMTDYGFRVEIKGEPEGENMPVNIKDGYKVTYPDGYVSWSPREAFELVYRLVTSGEIELIKP